MENTIQMTTNNEEIINKKFDKKNLYLIEDLLYYVDMCKTKSEWLKCKISNTSNIGMEIGLNKIYFITPFKYFSKPKDFQICCFIVNLANQTL